MSGARSSPVFRAFSRVVAWGTLPLFTVGIGSRVWIGHRIGIGFTLEDVSLFVGFGAFAAVGSLLVAKRPDNAVSWIMAAMGLIVGVFPALEGYAAFVMTTRGVPDTLAVFGAWANSLYWLPLIGLALIYLPLLFPNGRLLSPRWLPVIVIPTLALMAAVAISAVGETLYGQDLDYRIANPIGIPGMPSLEEHPWNPILFRGGFLLGLFGAIVSVAVRFRRSIGIERQQLKWFLSAAALGPLSIVSGVLIVEEILFQLSLIALPSAVAVAVLRYRLWDIDVIIRRTLQYTLLTGLLALIYFIGVVLLQGVLAPLTGDRNSQLVTVLTTLAIAALFNPLRTRVQAFIDRRLYRQKYNAEQSLTRFAAAARSEVDLERLSGALLSVVEETIHPERASLWLGK